MDKIDFVVSWVNPTDVEWNTQRKQYFINDDNSDLETNSAERYREFGFFKYWFRAVEKYAPWVNHVYLVTANQRPNFFKEDGKVSIVNHSDFIPSQYLPTFNSNVIDLYLDRIPGLSEHFVYFNDDMFLNAPVTPNFFFDDNGLPKDMAVSAALQPVSEFSAIQLNNGLVINANFNKKLVLKQHWRKFFSLKYGLKNIMETLCMMPFVKWSTFKNQHIAYSLRKSDYDILRNLAPRELESTSRMRFRSAKDISIWLIQQVRYMDGSFSPRSYRDGILLDFDHVDEIISSLRENKYKIVVINDDSADADLNRVKLSEKILSELQRKFKDPSSVEINVGN